LQYGHTWPYLGYDDHLPFLFPEKERVKFSQKENRYISSFAEDNMIFSRGFLERSEKKAEVHPKRKQERR